MADPMTTETAEMFMRQRDFAYDELRRVRSALTIAEDALRDIASGECMHIADAGDGYPAIDTTASSRVAEGAPKRMGV